jgi:uncharacterized protein
MTEAAWILRNAHGGVKGLFDLVTSGAVRIDAFDDQAASWIAAFVQRYASIQAQVADASIRYLAEKHDGASVFTLDRRDFSVYRTGKNQAPTLRPVL